MSNSQIAAAKSPMAHMYCVNAKHKQDADIALYNNTRRPQIYKLTWSQNKSDDHFVCPALQCKHTSCSQVAYECGVSNVAVNYTHGQA